MIAAWLTFFRVSSRRLASFQEYQRLRTNFTAVAWLFSLQVLVCINHGTFIKVLLNVISELFWVDSALLSEALDALIHDVVRLTIFAKSLQQLHHILEVFLDKIMLNIKSGH